MFKRKKNNRYYMRLKSADAKIFEKFRQSMLIQDILASQNKVSGDDETFRGKTTQQISDRDKEYTYLLRHFVEVTQVRNTHKEILKIILFVIILVIIVALSITTCLLYIKYFENASISDFMKSAPLLISPFIGFVSAIIVIPLTVTRYLFSTKEDDNITKIILHTQEHDMNGREWLEKYLEDKEKPKPSPDDKEEGDNNDSPEKDVVQIIKKQPDN